MRIRLLLWLLTVAAGLVLAWYAGLPGPVRERMIWLANQPGVREAFKEADYGRVDALITLISFFLLVPAGLLVVLLIFVFVLIVFALLFEPVWRLLRLPDWTSVAVTAAVWLAGAWLTSALWWPTSLHALGLVARAWLVYFSGPPPVPR